MSQKEVTEMFQRKKKQFHRGLERPLGRFPVGLASSSLLASQIFFGAFWTHDRTNVAVGARKKGLNSLIMKNNGQRKRFKRHFYRLFCNTCYHHQCICD